MSALTAFIEKGLATHYELNRIVDQTIFDQALTNPWVWDRTVMFPLGSDGKTIITNEHTRSFLDINGDQVRALTIHFQGGSKKLIMNHTDSPSLRIRFEYRLARVAEQLRAKFGYVAMMRRHYTIGVAKRIRRIALG